MKKLLFWLLGLGLFASAAFAGVGYSGKEMKQVAAPPPCPEWYADNEFNVSLWGTYVFTASNWRDDTYLEADHAWGGGMDFKYFFHRYFGVGIEGWAVDARQAREDVFVDLSDGIFSRSFHNESNLVGAVLGTFTLRYPIHCSRFSPYIFGGGGAIFGGGEERFFDVDDGDVVHDDTHTRAIGQFGGGLEIRFTRHIGWMSDFSWNVVDGPHNNFGMVRTGLNFAF